MTGPQCVFPFKLYGNVFNGCTLFGTNRPWCHTRVNLNTGIGFVDDWGFCHDDCPMEQKSLSGVKTVK